MIPSNDDHIVTFANGIKLFRSDITPEQLKRYDNTDPLLHEPCEEYWFEHIFERIANDQRGQVTEKTRTNTATFVDVGSALGYYCVLFKRRFPEANLIAVDPHEGFRMRMRETFLLNGLSVDDYHHIPFALYPHGSQVVFAQRDFGSYIAQGESTTSPITPNSIKVDVCSLEEVLGSVEGSIDLLKMDIQGAEQAVFNKNIALIDSGRVNHWMVGTHGAGIHGSLLDHLSRCHDILFEDHTPKGQIDGIIVAAFRC